MDRDLRARLPFLSLTMVVFVLAAVSCSPGQDASGGGDTIRKPTPARAQLPEQVLGLTVVQEDVTRDISQVKSATYVSSVALFSLREGELLQASLQVSRLNDLAKPNSESFRREVAGLISGGAFEELTVGDRKVYLTSGKQQIVYGWFKGRGFYVLTVRRAYSFRRTLLRRMLALEEPDEP